ncbi:enoyl-CoA hydratase [Alphaproteobacteria bacterium]|jgi:enoyl-CoA hydratase/carnithine racemase|nr:enoyl-CoA hydratase [Alphaproteobacteria bacterium]
MEKFFKISNVSNHVVKVELNNGKKHNPLSLELIKALTKSLKEVSSQENVKVLIISSEGPGFSAGHDLEELRQNKNNKEFFQNLFNECSNLMQTIMHLSQPVIAEVCGIAAAAGCQLVASCDLAVASENASFMTPGVNIGLFCSTPMVAVSRNISRKKIMEMLLTGESMSAKDAVDYGLINHCVPVNQLQDKTMSLANLIASKPISTVKIGKEAFYKQVEMPISEAYNYTSEVMAKNMLELDAHEGISAFLEKRLPEWN